MTLPGISRYFVSFRFFSLFFAFAGAIYSQSAAKPILDTVNAVCLEDATLKPCTPVKSTLPAPSAAPAPAKANTPSITWAGCGPTRYGSQTGATCAMAIPLVSSQGLYSWTSYDATFYRGKPVTTAGTGAALVIRTWTAGKWIVEPVAIGTVGATTSTSTGLSSYAGGALQLGYGHFRFTAHYRAAFGAAKVPAWGGMIGWRF